VSELVERRHALVTGGSRGIGRAVVLRLAADGYDVSFCSRADGPEAAQTVKEAEQHGGRVFHAMCDVARADAVDAFIKDAQAELGPVYALVNSAGITRDKPMVLMPHADWQAVIDTNLTGTFNVCRSAVFGLMKRKAGVVVNMSSVAGVYGNRAQTNYSASKAGIIGLSKSLAKEVAAMGIRVNVVAPGFIDTDMTAVLTGTIREKAMEMIPMRTIGTPENVADLVSFLISDRAAYITGQVVQVDGGIAL
jgi:3-oxoacyl-[acyl-carrier protein] reductase